MKKTPNMSGIDRRWNPAEDDRRLLEAKLLERGFDSYELRGKIDCFLDALIDVVNSNKRVKLVGVGTFQWMPWRNRIPTGKIVETWHLAFKPCRYRGKYNGDR